MKKLIITGANGVGKSTLAARLAVVRPQCPVVHFDALKLATEWHQKPRADIDAALSAALAKDAWIVEGGPSVLPIAVARADALIWLDPPELIRAWRLALRPWQSRGTSRPEVPAGNVDWPLQQYRFALRSLRNGAKFRTTLAAAFHRAETLPKWRCRSEKSVQAAINWWAAQAD